MKGFLNYLKGLAIGVCALIPGISGGTMALILGIYQRLITAVSSVDVKKSLLFFKLKKSNSEKRILKTYTKQLDLTFLLTIIFGVLSMLFVGAIGLSSLLKNHYAYTGSFFVGLIIASMFFIYKHVDSKKASTVIPFTFAGLLVGLSFLLVVPANLVNPPFWYLVFAGFLGISALFFPGISGSLILMLLGVYEFVINNILVDPFNNLIPILSIGIGMLLGAVLVSKLIAYLFRINKSAVLYFLLGLILGSIFIPINKVLDSVIPSNFFVGVFFVLGFVIVFVVDYFGRK